MTKTYTVSTMETNLQRPGNEEIFGSDEVCHSGLVPSDFLGFFHRKPFEDFTLGTGHVTCRIAGKLNSKGMETIEKLRFKIRS